MSTRRGLVNNLFLGAGVGANLYGAYFVLAFQGHLPPDWLPGALLGYDDAVARGDDRRSTRARGGGGRCPGEHERGRWRRGTGDVESRDAPNPKARMVGHETPRGGALDRAVTRRCIDC